MCGGFSNVLVDRGIRLMAYGFHKSSNGLVSFQAMDSSPPLSADSAPCLSELTLSEVPSGAWEFCSVVGEIRMSSKADEFLAAELAGRVHARAAPKIREIVFY